MSMLGRMIRRFARDSTGSSLLEYGVLAVLIAALSIVALSALGGKVSTGFALADAELP